MKDDFFVGYVVIQNVVDFTEKMRNSIFIILAIVFVIFSFVWYSIYDDTDYYKVEEKEYNRFPCRGIVSRGKWSIT